MQKLFYNRARNQLERIIEMLYRVEGEKAYVDAIYHYLQDYENIFQ